MNGIEAIRPQALIGLFILSPLPDGNRGLYSLPVNRIDVSEADLLDPDESARTSSIPTSR